MRRAKVLATLAISTWPVVLPATGACTAGLRGGDPVRVENATVPSRRSDSARVHVTYSAPRSCTANVQADADLVGDTVRLALSLPHNARCEGPDTTSSLDRWLPIGMTQGVRIAARQPDGTVSSWNAPPPPPRPCPGPAFAFDWGTAEGRPDYEVGQQYRLVVRRTCPEPGALQATWTAEDTTIVTLRTESDTVTTLVPRAPGSTRIYLQSSFLVVRGGFEVVVRE